MNRPGIMKIMRVDDLQNYTFVDGPELWKRWELDDRPLLYKDDYGMDDFVIEDIKKAKSLAEKFIPEEEMFQPRQVASCLISLLVRVIPVQLGWTPVFGKVIPSAREYYILKLNEKESNWSLIYWNTWDKSKHFSSMDFPVKADPDSILIPRISQMSSYDIINKHIYSKLKAFKEELLAKRKK